jgi:hypothetical protein
MAPVRCAGVELLALVPAIKALRPHTVFDNLHRVVQPKALRRRPGLRRISSFYDAAMVVASTLTPTPIVLETATLRR